MVHDINNSNIETFILIVRAGKLFTSSTFKYPTSITDVDLSTFTK